MRDIKFRAWDEDLPFDVVKDSVVLIGIKTDSGAVLGKIRRLRQDFGTDFLMF